MSAIVDIFIIYEKDKYQAHLSVFIPLINVKMATVIQLINVKISTIVGILTFMNRINI